MLSRELAKVKMQALHLDSALLVFKFKDPCDVTAALTVKYVFGRTTGIDLLLVSTLSMILFITSGSRVASVAQRTGWWIS